MLPGACDHRGEVLAACKRAVPRTDKDATGLKQAVNQGWEVRLSAVNLTELCLLSHPTLLVSEAAALSAVSCLGLLVCPGVLRFPQMLFWAFRDNGARKLGLRGHEGSYK